MLREEAGNGVVTDYTYELQTQRLAALRTTRPTQAGRSPVLQALSYKYDPVGNLLAIGDAAKATHYTRNQRVEPTSTYTYDALYQLTQTTGRENANAGRQTQALPPPIVPLWQETGKLTNYTCTYTYDRGANVTAIHHQGTTPYTQQTLVAPSSNRAVPQTGGLTPGDVNGCFDACGNLKALGSNQPLSWDSRNQLQRATRIVRSGPDDDSEVYIGTTAPASGPPSSAPPRPAAPSAPSACATCRGWNCARPNRPVTATPRPHPSYACRCLPSARLAANRCGCCTELGKPPTIESDQWRVSLDDQIGSSRLELDARADLLTWEEYFPFGGTAVWSARSDTEAKYKYVRYSGQERDATGLYYYGLRYYAPWLSRWLNPDPAGAIDGLNLFRMVRNSPVNLADDNGLYPPIPEHRIDLARKAFTQWRQYISRSPGDALLPVTSGTGQVEASQEIENNSNFATGSPNNSKQQGKYFFKDLERRLENLAKSSTERESFVRNENEFSHLQSDDFTITSYPENVNGYFMNKYKPNKWTFKENSRGSDVTQFFANDVTRVQYEKVAKSKGFFGFLPTLIKRKNVINDETLRVTSNISNCSQELLAAFMERTSNGKSTARILADFGLIATRVEMRRADEQVDFLISVRPSFELPANSDHQRLKRALSRSGDLS